MIKHLKKWCTLGELMIVIGVIGILAAALFPSLSGYLSRSRNATRITVAKQYIWGISLYSSDKWNWPPNIFEWSDCAWWDSDRDGSFLTALYTGGYISTRLPQIKWERRIDAITQAWVLVYSCTFGNFSYINYGFTRPYPTTTPGSSTDGNIACPVEKWSAYAFGIHIEWIDYVDPKSPWFRCGSDYFMSPHSYDGGKSRWMNYLTWWLHQGNYIMGETMY